MKKEHHMLVTKLFELLFSVCILLIVGGCTELKALANTYDTIWYLSSSSTDPHAPSAGNLHLYYTYPNRVYTGQQFHVGVYIAYIKDTQALVDWMVFTGVSVGLKNYSALEHAKWTDTDSSGDADLTDVNFTSRVNDSSSVLIRPGEAYSHSFNLTAPAPGMYVLFPTWNAFYGPGTITDNNFAWDLNSYYNQTHRVAGKILPEDYPPIYVLNKNPSKKEWSLNIGICPPYTSWPVDLTIASTTKAKQFQITSGNLSLPYPTGSNETITLPKTFDIIPNNIRAVFVNWSDGQTSKGQNPNIRTIVLDHDQELYAIYKTQYHLSVKSIFIKDNTPNNGTGWYDSGDEARYSINPLAGLLLSNSFDHWNGPIPIGENTVTSGSITMNGPKEITASWKFDLVYLGAILGLATGIITLASFLTKVNSKTTQRFFMSVRRFWIGQNNNSTNQHK